MKLSAKQKKANKKLAADYRKSLELSVKTFSNIEKAKEYLDSLGFSFKSAQNFNYEKHVIYGNKNKFALLKTVYKFDSPNSMDMGYKYEVTML
jgi:DNA-binding XRE family transcriptional regulator